MLKKVFVLSIILVQIMSIKVLATTKTESLIYEEREIPLALNLNDNEGLPEEVKGDFSELRSVKQLILKTESNYELAKSTKEGTYEFIEEFENLEEAINKANNLKKSFEEDGLQVVILDNKGNIIYSNLGMGKIIKHVDGVPYPSNNKNTDIYKEHNLQQKLTYINHGYVDDVPIIEDNGLSAKIQVSGAVGWVNKDSSKAEFDMIVVPLNQVTNPSYYINENGILNHFISYDISGQVGKGHKIAIGKAPSFMNNGQKYFSYDLEYFY